MGAFAESTCIRNKANPNKKYYQLINLDVLQELIDSKSLDVSKEINGEALCSANLLKKANVAYKVLGRGEIKSPISINTAFISKSAREKIEKIGGKILNSLILFFIRW